MADDPVMQKFEAAEEQQLEINKLKAEKGELERKIRQLELEKSTVADKLDDVWTAINKLQKETRESGNNSVRLQQKNEEKYQARRLQLQITKVSSKVDQIRETITNQGKPLDSIARTMDSISQNTVEVKTILIIGGEDGSYCTNRTMTVLSTDRSDWIKSQLELPYTVMSSGAAFLHNELYFVGASHNQKPLYKLDENLKWKRLADMNVARQWITNSCLDVNGYIWVFGGEDRFLNGLKSVERYDSKEDKWTLMPEMSIARASAAAVFWKDRIIVCGGMTGKGITSSAECFLLETGKWTQFPPLPDNLACHSLVSYENKLILMGGVNNNYERLKSVWEMDPLQPNDGWKSLPSMKYSHNSFPGLVLDQAIYAIGGDRDDTQRVLEDVEMFDGKSWRDGPSLPSKPRGHSAAVIPQSLADRLCQHKP